MYKYKVVRSYGPASRAETKELREAFEEGYEFVRASEYIEGKQGYPGYIEYILRKKENKECSCFIPEGLKCEFMG